MRLLNFPARRPEFFGRKFRHTEEILHLQSCERLVRATSLLTYASRHMTPSDKRERARKLREVAATKQKSLADEIIALARQLERAADEQEREARKR